MENGGIMNLLWWMVEIVSSMYMVDLVSGMVHLYLDYQVIDDETLRKHVEKSIVAIQEFEKSAMFRNATFWDQFLWDFQIHHQVPFPAAVSEWELTMQIARPVALPYIISACAYAMGFLNGSFARIWLLTLTWSPFVQATHFAAHRRTHGKLTNSAICVLQDYGLLLSAASHKKHHEEFDCNFCIFNGWANPVVNWIGRVCFGTK